MVQKIVEFISARSRARRAELFCSMLEPTEHDRILDLGSEDGRYIAAIVPYRKNVFIADIDVEMLSRGDRQFGFNTVLLNENGTLPFEDGYFHIVHCNSVIEHVGITKSEQWLLSNGVQFANVAFKKQKAFADEIRRVGRSYFVQTPNKRFLFESHTWLPFVQFLPRPLLVKAIRWLNKWWVKKNGSRLAPAH
jgi:SAM-dependent methyltransferase